MLAQDFEDLKTKTQTTLPRRRPPDDLATEEQVFQHYLRVLAQLLDYFGIPEGPREFIEAIAIELGFDYKPPKDNEDETSFVRVYDGELADCVCASISLKEAAEQRLRRQRKKLWEWQAERDAEGKRRAQVVEIKRDFDFETRQYAHSYRFPLGALIRNVVAIAPAGSGDRELTATITRQAGEFLRRQAGRKKNLPPKRTHSPESNFNRALTLLVDGFESATRQESPGSAKNLLTKTVRERLTDPKNCEASEALKTIYLILGDLVGGCDHNDHTPAAEIEQRDFINTVLQFGEGTDTQATEIQSPL